MKHITAKNLRAHINEHVASEARIMTDGFASYKGLDKEYKSHEVVDHAAGEYARGEAHINTAESWFAILKRGVYGTFHHVSDQHLDRYVAEFSFRWNYRGVLDIERTIQAVHATGGKH